VIIRDGTAKRIEIDVPAFDIDKPMRRERDAVDADQGPGVVHPLGNRRHIVDGPGDVGYVRQRNQAGARAQKLVQQRYI